jgi:hypothetical protein
MQSTIAIHDSLRRQVNHWLQAGTRLSAFENLASSNAWHGVERKMGVLLKESLQKSIEDVIAKANNLKRQLETNLDPDQLRAIKRGLLSLRDSYLKAEETIHFYTVALNSRTTAGMAALLRACDILCEKSMREILQQLGKETPYVLTYIDKGVGASILKAGLRLWDGRISPVAAIKVTHHNLYRTTAIIHETGHQVAHILNWTEQLADAFRTELKHHPEEVREAYASWASEIAADAFAFVHTGFAAVASLNDVISGSPQAVFAWHQHDPHPISYIRVLMNIEMCRLFFGAGPWDTLEDSFKNDYDINLVNFSSTGMIRLCVPALADVARIILKTPYRAFGNKPLSLLIPPERVSPKELERLEYLAGPALFTSHAWVWKESLRLLALTGLKIGIGKGNLPALYKQQEEWMTQLGFAVELN